jgi:predicted nuclease of predicted toxin-antitoxin system
MRFKVDENLHPEVAARLCAEGHDAMTVFEQGLRGHPDDEIAVVCQAEQRVILTLDLDFSNIRRYPPQDYAGIIVLRPGSKGRASVMRTLTQFMPLLSTVPLIGHLWIVEEQRIRIRNGSA